MEPVPAGPPRLTVELVPRSCWYSNVRDHVPRATWDGLRRATYRQAGDRCEVCGGRGPRWPVECHEVWEYDEGALTQRLVRLVALCPSCHEVKHLALAGMRGRLPAALRHLARVNGWTSAQARAYADEQFRVFEHRSERAWHLDLSWLRERGIAVVERR